MRLAIAENTGTIRAVAAVLLVNSLSSTMKAVMERTITHGLVP